ncbi:zinc finger protein RFP-like [Mobula hypostoma]|uniref:zinc finger protein RFP-like n=1 Tax=Mobula hypostoma TaxID=723540 RepID=UPI002FC32A14
MASKGQIESLTEDAICPICLDFFTDPVSPECGHSFCRSCITRCWEKAERNSCSQCREQFAYRTLRVNRDLILSDKFRGLTLTTKEKEIKFHCKEHEEELKMFCEADKKLMFVMCTSTDSCRFKKLLKSIKYPALDRVFTLLHLYCLIPSLFYFQDCVKSSLDSLRKKKSNLVKMEQKQKEKISRVRPRLACERKALESTEYRHVKDVREVVTDRFLCTGGNDPSQEDNTCYGDSGGSLFINKTRRFFQAGVVSWGSINVCTDFNPDRSSARDFHINLFKVQPWLRQSLQGTLVFIN